MISNNSFVYYGGVMKKTLLCVMTVLLLLSYAGNAQAVLGIPDRVPAATLIVPMFEVSTNFAVDSMDTLPVITNVFGASYTVHWEVWDVNGNSTIDLFGNTTIGPFETIPFSMSELINSASPATRAQLLDGSFYRGFMTFDIVTAPTSSTPKSGTYPFGNSNVLEGWIYYTRLLQGSSNGISMLPLEATSGATNINLRDFYQFADLREEIDATARLSSQSLSQGGGIIGNTEIDRVHARVFLSPALNGSSRVVIFTYPAQSFCTSCGPGVVTARMYDEDGNLIIDSTVNLNRIVNIIDVFASENGWVSFWNIPDGWETYAFSINAASPGFNPALTWDAIFESFIIP